MNLAINSLSNRRPNFPYTTPGLGDRTHTMLCAYQYSKKHNVPVTIHITSDKCDKDHKFESWNQLQRMIPNVNVMVWPVKELSEKDWRNYLKQKGFESETYFYSDTASWLPLQGNEGIDFAKYFKELPCLEPVDCSSSFGNIPKKFATFQFDSTDDMRGAEGQKLIALKEKYESEGYKLITIGGKSKHKKLKESLQHIGYLISKADIHIGADSGMFHLAQLYKPWNKIHLLKGSFLSHHAHRAIINGVTLI